MDPQATERVKELTAEVIAKFNTEFIKSYTECIVEKAKEEVEGGDDLEYELESAPTPSEYLKTGTLTKLGGFVKNWKVRHFIAYNEADNFKLEYYEKEGGKLKGIVAPCGYRVELFDEDDTAKYGDCGLKLVGDSGRRIWYFRAPTAEERDQWVEVLKQSCYKAKPQRNENAAIADAFDKTYWKIRWWYCLWGSYRPYGTEDERLALLLVSILEREVLNEVFDKIPSSPARGALISAIRSPIEATVTGAVGSAWTTSTLAAKSLTDTLEASVKKLITPLLEKEKEIKDQIVDKVTGIVNPVIADKAASLLKPVLIKAVGPIGKAFTRGANDFAEKVRELIGNNELEPSKFKDTVAYLDRQYYWILYKGFDIVWDFCSNIFGQIMSAASNSMSYYEVYYMTRDSMNSIFHNAVYTFQKAARDADPSRHLAILAEVMGKYVHDSKIAAKDLIVRVLRAVLDIPVQELMLKPASAVTEPIQSMVDAIPVPGLSTLFNLPSMVEDVIESIVESALVTLVESGFGETLASEFNAIRI